MLLNLCISPYLPYLLFSCPFEERVVKLKLLTLKSNHSAITSLEGLTALVGAPHKHQKGWAAIKWGWAWTA